MSLVASLYNDRSPQLAERGDFSHCSELQAVVPGLLGELLNSALMTAMTASSFNGMQRSTVARDASLLTSHLSPVPTLFKHERPRLLEMEAVRDLVGRLDEYYDELFLLRRLLLDGHGTSDNSDEAFSHSADLWRNLSAIAATAIEKITPLLPEDTLGLFEDRIEFVMNLVRRAASGETPCLDEHGAVKMPNWGERRSGSRKYRGMHAFLQIGDSIQRVGVLDSSVTGIGMLGLVVAKVGLRVSLLVRPGVEIGGTIVWVNGARSGLKLDSPLPTDSLLRVQ